MIKICFYCDSIFSVGGVQRILAVIAGAISAKHEVTILTLDKPDKCTYPLLPLHDAAVCQLLNGSIHRQAADIKLSGKLDL